MIWAKSRSSFHRVKVTPPKRQSEHRPRSDSPLPTTEWGESQSEGLPRWSMKSEPDKPEVRDPWIKKFLQHLSTDRGASVYTQRNYRQAIFEFYRCHQDERQQPPAWATLQRDDFRSYLRFLGRHDLGRAAIQLRFSALRTFYKFLIRHGAVNASPIKNISLP